MVKRPSQCAPALGGALFIFIACLPVHSQADSTSTKAPSYEEVERQRIEASRQGAAAALTWRNELVRKGRLYPVALHAWLAEATRIHAAEGEKAALDYCARRRIKMDGGNIHVGVEHSKWYGKKQRAILEKFGEIVAEGRPLGVEIKVPISSISGLAASADIYFVRPMPLDSDVERMAKQEQETRSDGQVMRGRSEKWRVPTGELADVGTGVVGVGFKSIGEEKRRWLLYSYGCWTAQHHPMLDYVRYSVAYREGDKLDDVMNWLGHDPEVSFIEPMFLLELLQQ